MAAFVSVDVRSFLRTIPPGSVVLNAGSSSRRYDGLRTINLDVQPGRDVNCLGDLHDAPLRSESVDVVVCVAVLQYCEHPQRVIAELARVLKPGGQVYLDVPFLQPVCQDGRLDDLWRFTPRGVQRLVAPWFDVEVCAPSIASGSMLSHILVALAGASPGRIRRAVFERAAWHLTKPLWSVRRPTAAANGASYLIGRKRGVRA